MDAEGDRQYHGRHGHHLGFIVDDLDAAEAAVIDLGATKHPDRPGTSFRVFLDPAGHPFCLCLN